MLSFENDYSQGAHARILERLVQTNMEPQPGYGGDAYCEQAKEKLRAACDCPDADIFFLVGGTQTNATVIDGLLQSYEGVLSAVTGHVSVHEAGAIEQGGHKVLPLPSHDGKISPQELAAALRSFWEDANHEHMVFPGMVYLSHPTENGTLYTKRELEEISEICHEYKIPLYLDGARLGYGLAATHTDVTLPIIARCCDAFYIGGTKVGALCGEAVIFPRHGAPRHFFTTVKQHGALLAKGRLLGVQFDALFTDDLYFQISRHAIAMAELLKAGLQEAGFVFSWDSPTNQQFLLLEDEQAARLGEGGRYAFWEKPVETHTIIRLATSWATEEAQVRELLDIMKAL